MKKLIIIFLLIPILTQGQDRWLGNDKIQHFTTSTTLSFAGGQILESVTGWKYSYEYALIGVIGIGMMKEIAFDASPSYKDATLNLIGAFAGYYVNQAINKKIKAMNCLKTNQQTAGNN